MKRYGVDNPYGTCNGCNASGIPASGPFVTHNNIAGYARIKTSGVTAKYTQDLGGPTLTVIGDYSSLKKDYQEDSDASPATLFEFFNGSKVNQESLEARINGRRPAAVPSGEAVFLRGGHQIRVPGSHPG
jgi:hypothetical protein